MTNFELRDLVRRRAKNRCEYCLLRQEHSDLTHHIEHIVAKQHSGSDELSNSRQPFLSGNHLITGGVMDKQETATLGGGCFWCLEAVYVEMEGVESVVSGYMGGHVAHPTYEQVCGKRTGHVEVVQVTFDPEVTNFREILEVFFAIHDPTTRDRQGNDVGPQYRSVIFTHSDAQQVTAQQVIRDLEAEKIFDAPIVTDVLPAPTFYPAENYHQNYFATHQSQPYCAFVVSPKVKKFRQKFAHKMRVAS